MTFSAPNDPCKVMWDKLAPAGATPGLRPEGKQGTRHRLSDAGTDPGGYRPPQAEAFAVGTGVTAGPPHRSQRALLMHWAPALDPDVEAVYREWVTDFGSGQPPLLDARHPCSSDPSLLAST